MNYDLIYSLRMALETYLLELNDVEIIRAGVSLSALERPFATVEYLQDGHQLMAAGRDSHYDTYNYQVGLFASNLDEFYRLEKKMRKVLRVPEGHPLYAYDEVTETFVDTGELIPFNDNGFTPIGNDDSSNQTYDFHGYFDVGIEIY